MQVPAYGNTKPVPFAAAIMQSTALESTMAFNISFNATAAIAVSANCNATDSFSTSPAMIDCLRSLPMETLLNLTLDFINPTLANNDRDIFLPTVDQDFLPDLASSLVAEGKLPKIPFMAGWQEDDATLFTNSVIETNADTRAFFEVYYPDLNSTTLTNLLNLYPVDKFTANITANKSAELYRAAHIFRDILLTCPSAYFGSSMAKKYANVFDPTPSDYDLAKWYPGSWSAFAHWSMPSVEGKRTLEARSSAFPNGEGEGEVYVVGGGKPGMRGPGLERLDESCGFLNSEVVIEQLKY
ncbi:hypothetical protein G7Y89_g8611 [Cudoniella acicularis]|uniref:Carboxylesterase type B domain-containing protein n=1 Tax=Cudoniella acicularis TaxID=354080 RepID=A0A8H4W3E4_9HELO|nr:hypothetical protein G7Y89_g8611 [Cudoniella acicularis]